MLSRAGDSAAAAAWRRLRASAAVLPAFRRMVLLLVGVSIPLSASAVAVVDAAGAAVTLDAPARRVVTLSPHAAELVFAVGGGARLVGAVQYTDYPPAARNVPRIGGYEALNLEAILALEPDLVVGWESGNPSDQVAHLKRLGLTVYLSEPRRVDDILADMEKLARLLGTEGQAAPTVAGLRRRYDALARTYRDRSPVSVFYQVWHRPLITVNGQHLISEVIRLCGGRNVFADLNRLAPQISAEAVFAADPDAILIGQSDPEPALAQWRRRQSLRAVRAGELHTLPTDLLQRASPRILDGAERLCEVLQRVREGAGSGGSGSE